MNRPTPAVTARHDDLGFFVGKNLVHFSDEVGVLGLVLHHFFPRFAVVLRLGIDQGDFEKPTARVGVVIRRQLPWEVADVLNLGF
mgnify:CR=1 FL=1